MSLFDAVMRAQRQRINCPSIINDRCHKRKTHRSTKKIRELLKRDVALADAIVKTQRLEIIYQAPSMRRVGARVLISPRLGDLLASILGICCEEALGTVD